MKRRILTLLLTLAVASPAFGDATIFNGAYVQTLKDQLRLYATARILTGTADPTSSATLGEKGSLYLRQTAAGDGLVYIKTDGGTTTNWRMIATSPASTLTASKAVVTDASGYLTTSATTATQVGYLSGATGTTGSGLLVYGTSPTFITPALGTPASGVLTNATGLPLTSGVTGILPVANGGTGQSSLTAHTVLVGNGTSGVTQIANGTTGQVLTAATGADPAFGPASAVAITSLTGDVTGTGPGATATTVAAIQAKTVSGTTGTTNVVFSNGPTLVAPALGAATATSINKMAITAPATSSTLAVADGKTLTASNTLTFTGTDGSSVAFGGGGTVAYTALNTNNINVGDASNVRTPVNTALIGGARASVTTQTFTVTLASPAVFTITSHGYGSGQTVYFQTTGALPTGLSANTTYWIHKIDANTFNVSTSLANLITANYVNTSGSQSGTQSSISGGTSLDPTQMDAQIATRLGLMMYSGSNGQVYNGGITPTLTGTPTGYRNQNIFLVPYVTADGTWRLRYNISYDTNGNLTSSIGFTSITGVTNSSTVQAQSVSIPAGNGVATVINASVRSSSFEADFSTTVGFVCMSGDIFINGKPTWAF